MNPRGPKEVFEALAARNQQLVTGKTLLGAGANGLVLEDSHGILTKLVKKPHSGNLDDAEAVLRNETNVARLLRGLIDPEIEIPVILSEPEHVDDQEFFMQYKMTKISGSSADWNWKTIGIFKTPELQQRHFQDAGRILAKFHRAVAGLVTGDQPSQSILVDWRNSVEQIKSASNAVNEALKKADTYLRAHKKPAVTYGDFHGGNLMTDESGRVTGFLDLDRVGFNGNHLNDFINVPAKVLHHFIAGYEEQSGEIINRDVLAMMHISELVAYINHVPAQSAVDMDVLREQLAASSKITGYKLPRP